MVAKTMMQNESVIDSAIQAIAERLEEDPANIAAPMMLKLLQGSKEMILAHKSMMKYGEVLMTGGYIADPPDTIQ
jgi:hydrogenase maturation factor HypF (carbamoyltransferase family)